MNFLYSIKFTSCFSKFQCKQYEPDILKVIEQGLEPELACKVIKLCPGKSFLVFTKDGNKYMYHNLDSNVHSGYSNIFGYSDSKI